MAFLFEYGLFLAKAVTIIFAIAVVIMLVVGASHRPKTKKGEIEVTDLSESLAKSKEQFLEQTLDKKALKARNKAQSREQKNQDKIKETVKNVFYIEFNGSMDAHEVSGLREEINAILTIADKATDQVIVSVESGGGVVHGYGLGASQLTRIKQAGIPLTVCVDKVAASGGYMMACVADKIIAAPFAIIGSIGVIAQIPNFNRLLKKNNVDFEMVTAGEYKRTLTLFGENTDKGREKFKEEIEQTHGLFKHFVAEHRAALEIEKVATGEHWFGTQALALKLVDEISTSDDLLMSLNENHQLYKVRYRVKRGVVEKFGLQLGNALERVAIKTLSKLNLSKYSA
ncbi:protease SohB [Pseudoalteromonas peptidolytica]|uniref:Serine protease SohB n=1 Tax=Pseudoalteromonas peptidolytica F12-50-A1 TaxID=1315280 RepID=A0A8I0T602_9GAMM|nr:protease SohB [Pseudoalteromonas peptidolytica]MBE0346714.1 serine protease SohB [Pseudoalteromonas peptidolytica F12-50-A1]NLR13625.1 protease SohB [Pseudoalteromonas peptidolytica]GEK10279.1 periplasmic protease [Pseudoalteromonas peptidolytica]